MTKEILVKIEDFDGEVDQANDLMKRLKSLDYLMFHCNFGGYGEVGEVLMDIRDETNRKMKSLIKRSEVHFYEIDKKGNKIKFKYEGN